MLIRLVSVLVFAAAARSQGLCPSPTLYTPCDLVFDIAPEEVGSLQLHAEVKSPKFKTALVPAFFDGSRKWIIRFAPVDAGQYDYRLTSNLSRFNGKTGSVQIAPSDHPGFIRPANAHHWVHPDNLKPHLWVGGINHERVALPVSDKPTDLQPLEAKIRDLNKRSITADLVLAPSPAEITRRYPTWQEREKWMRVIVSRFAAFDITWMLVAKFEGESGARPLLKELGDLLKKTDPYNHPRSTGAAMTTSPLAADGWMDYIAIGSDNDALPSVEHQFFTRPFVNIATAKTNPTEFRHQLWNATMDGQYPSFKGGDPAVLKAWKEFFERTRFWELEPYFDLDGGRGLALGDVEYIVYVEKPSGPVEVTVEKHSYDVYWFNPATGELAKEKKDYKGEHFVAEPPSKDHDWVLHLSRDGRKEGMLKSYRFAAGDFVPQEIEMTAGKVPFDIAEPAADQLSISAPPKFAAKLKRDTRATRQMTYVWTGEVVSDGQGGRIIGLGANGTFNLTKDLALKFPAVFNVRLSAINANGKAYAVDRVYQLVP